MNNWQLDRYYYAGIDDDALHADIDRIPELTKNFVKKYFSVFPTFSTVGDFREFYEDYAEFVFMIRTPEQYLFYLSALDSQDQRVLALQRQLGAQYARVAESLLFIGEGWKKLGASRIRELADDPELARYRNDLIRTADSLQYLLDEKNESILIQKSATLRMPIELYDELVGSFVFSFKKGSEMLTLTEESVRAYRQSSDRTLRKNAYDSLRSVYNLPSHQITLGHIYRAIVKDNVSDARIRGYGDNPLSERNQHEQLDDAVVNMLIQTVEESYPLYHRYLAQKCQNLGLDRADFAIWDTTAPVAQNHEKIPFESGFALHLEMAEAFDPEYAAFSREMLENGRIDVFPRKNKRSGAFASYRAGDPSFVFLNYTDQVRDVFTLSHELGHAYHGHLAQEQSAAVYDTPYSLAETASIFSEKLLSDFLKSRISDISYFSYLDEKLSDVFATVHRQIQYVSFERSIHEQIAHGEELGYRDLCTLWRAEQTKLYGAIIYDVDAESESTWAQIPHIFRTPFYCYAYAFGQILSYSLFARIQSGALSRDDYKKILRSGGSLPPRELLLQYDIDITSRDFFDAGIREIERMVEEYESFSKYIKK